tara:strand:+ start:2317 stop:2892 length:576 start_codon:yes stop_codon:yes gene_type:complete
MIKIGVLGDIGSGKSFIAKLFGCPVFNADEEVKKVYRENKNCYKKLNKAIPKYISSFPIDKKEITKAIISNPKNIKKINKIVHPIIRSKINKFINKNKKNKIIILDVPLLLENKISKETNILIFVDAKRKAIIKNLKKRKNYNFKIIKILKNFQLPLLYKKRKSDFIIKNNFKVKNVKKSVKLLKKKVLYR